MHNERKPSLLIVSPGFPADENDSTCLPTQQLLVRSINRLRPDLEVMVIAINYPYRKGGYRWFGNEILTFGIQHAPKFLKPLLWWRIVRMLKKKFTDSPPTGVLSYWCTDAALIGKKISALLGIKHRIWISGQDAKKENRFVRWIDPRSEELVAMSDFLAGEFEKNHRIRPGSVVPNGVVPGTSPCAKTIDILGAGSLIPLKRFDIFIAIAQQLLKVKPGLVINLIGDGPERKNIEHAIAQAGLQNRIILLGELSHSSILSHMDRAKLLVHPSAYEGYSTVCLEALSRGVHVISSTWAEKRNIPHWHVVQSDSEMVALALKLLNEEGDFKPVVVHDLGDSARSFLDMFELN